MVGTNCGDGKKEGGGAVREDAQCVMVVGFCCCDVCCCGDVVKDVVKDVVRDVVKDAVRDVVGDVVRDAVKDFVEQVVEEVVKAGASKISIKEPDGVETGDAVGDVMCENGTDDCGDGGDVDGEPDGVVDKGGLDVRGKRPGGRDNECDGGGDICTRFCDCCGCCCCCCC